MAKHVIVISEDALVYEDLAYLKTLPNFARIWPRCAFVDRLRTVYPSVTYPVHTSMRTGVYPARHGIVNNETPRMCEEQSVWHFFQEDVRAPDLFDAAKAAGLRTAAVYWPVTGKHPSIDYLVNEYWPQHSGESTLDCFASAGSSAEVMTRIVEPYAHLIDGKHRVHPYCDEFISACACAMIYAFQPNLLMVHLANIDGYRHASGIFSPLVTHGLHEIDGWLGDMLKAVEDMGMLADTDFFIVSDHGQCNIRGVIHPNVLLREAGLIDVNEAGEITSWRAFCKSSALSTQVYLHAPEDRETLDTVYALLCRLRDEEVYGIERVYTAKEALAEEGLAGGFSFVLESSGIYTFGNAWQRPLIRPLTNTDYRFGRATHGHHPDKGPQPPLLAFGPDILPGAALAERPIVDVAATVARALGISLPGTDSAAMDALFR